MNKDFQWLPIHNISKDLEIRAVGLPFFHAFTDVTLYVHFAERAGSLHGKHGRFSKTPQMFSPASAKDHILFYRQYGNYRGICLYYV